MESFDREKVRFTLWLADFWFILMHEPHHLWRRDSQPYSVGFLDFKVHKWITLLQMWCSLRFNSCFYEWHYISGNSLQAHFFSTCLRKTLGKTEAWQDCSVCNVQVTFVSWNVIRATRSIKGAVKVAPDPNALFIYSITESVNRGLNKAEFWPCSPSFMFQCTQWELVPLILPQ